MNFVWPFAWVMAKVSGIDDVHADQHVPSGKSAPTNWDLLYHYAIRKAEVLSTREWGICV